VTIRKPVNCEPITPVRFKIKDKTTCVIKSDIQGVTWVTPFGTAN
jgi:hypothetical protein